MFFEWFLLHCAAVISIRYFFVKHFVHKKTIFKIAPPLLWLSAAPFGFENKEIKRGVRLNKLGYDEFDSRFGRVYVHLLGATLADVRKICAANSIADPETQKNIFGRCEPVKAVLEDGRSIQVIGDLRRIKRLVKAEHLKSVSYGN